MTANARGFRLPRTLYTERLFEYLILDIIIHLLCHCDTVYYCIFSLIDFIDIVEYNVHGAVTE